MATVRKKKSPAHCPAAILAAFKTIIFDIRPARVWLAQRSFFFFCWYYFDFKLTAFQLVWFAFLQKTKYGLVLAPRGHGKSELLAKYMVLWLVCKNRNVRILLVSVTQSLGIKHVQAIADEFTKNDKLIADFGAFYDPNNRWGPKSGQIQVIRKFGGEKDFTVEAIGVLGAVTGAHFDYVIGDDIIDTLSAREAAQREKVELEIKGTYIPLLPSHGRFWCIGTRKHFADIYSWMIENPLWSVIANEAIIRYPENWKYVKLTEPVIEEDGMERWIEVEIDPDGDHGEVLWADEWPIRRLLLQSHMLGTMVFNREYSNLVVSDEDALFKIAALEQCRSDSLSYVIGDLSDAQRARYVAIFTGVDPSLVTDKKTAEANKSDYMVMWTIGLLADGTRELIGLDRERGITPANVEKKIILEWKRLSPQLVFVEANSFGMIHTHNLIENTGMPLVKHWTGGNKHDLYHGVPMLAALFENRKYVLPYATEEDKAKTKKLIEEFHTLGFGKHDDIVMGGWILETGVHRYLTGQARIRKTRQKANRKSRK